MGVNPQQSVWELDSIKFFLYNIIFKKVKVNVILLIM